MYNYIIYTRDLGLAKTHFLLLPMGAHSSFRDSQKFKHTNASEVNYVYIIINWVLQV